MTSVKVWDLFVRFFHWALVLSVIGQFSTGEDFQFFHIRIGYFLTTLILVRIIWGFIGTKHARFNDFLYKPSEISRYLKGLTKGNPDHYIGHNPAGGAMVVLLLIALLFTAFAGLNALAAEGKGPFANNRISILSKAYADNDEHEYEKNATYKHGRQSESGKEKYWEEIHEAMTTVIIVLVIVHITGVIASSWIHRENLILAMITGEKKMGKTQA